MKGADAQKEAFPALRKEVDMCTSIAVFQGGGYFGRNLDLEYSFGEQPVVMPRRFPLHFHRLPDMDSHFAMVGMANVAENYPLYAEAANEKGLYMAGLNFPGNAWYEGDIPEGCSAAAPWELIPWILGSCENLAQAREKLSRFRPLAVPFALSRPAGAVLPLALLHWHIADRTGALVLEATREGVFLYDDPAGVLTNNPPFPFHQMNLNQYQTLSARPAENRFSSAAPLKAFGQGMGAIGLPGDASPASRYVKAAFHKLNAPERETEDEQVSQFFHLLDSVAMVRGSVVTEEGRFDITTYSCCISVQKGIYYYKTSENSRIRAVRLFGENLNAEELLLFPLCEKQDIRFLN